MVDLAPAVATPHGQDEMSQFFFIESAPILRRRYDVLVTGPCPPGTYLLEFISQNPSEPIFRSDAFIVTPEIAADIRAEIPLVAPAYGKITVRVAPVPQSAAATPPAPPAPDESAPEPAPVSEPESAG